MLKIKKLKSYNYAKYPRMYFYNASKSQKKIMLVGISTLTLSTIITLCESTTNEYTTSGIEAPSSISTETTSTRGKMLEQTARSIINQVFNDNSISLTNDFPYSLQITPTDSVNITIDGYDTTKLVGYEYISNSDVSVFNSTVKNKLNYTTSASGPYIKCIDELYVGQESYLINLIQQFIDYLKAQGKI